MADLDPYVAGEQPGDRRYVKLNTNENPFPPSPLVKQRVAELELANLRLYPHPDGQPLVKAIADYYAVPETSVMVGNGSDEILAFAFMAFFKQRRPLYFPEITYSFYPSYCRLFEIESRNFPLRDDWQIDFANLQGEPGGLIFPNPNAPTGRLLSLSEIETVVQRFSDIVVIVDEAYIDFGGESAAALTQQYANLLVIQTLSKSRSLAGMRVGFAIAQPHLIDGLQRVKNSFNAYPLDLLAITSAVAAMEDREYFEQTRQQIIANRTALVAELSALGFHSIPSSANFVFTQHQQKLAADIGQALRQQGILVRYFNRPKVDNYLRISIGLESEMQTLVQALKSIV